MSTTSRWPGRTPIAPLEMDAMFTHLDDPTRRMLARLVWTARLIWGDWLQAAPACMAVA